MTYDPMSINKWNSLLILVNKYLTRAKVMYSTIFYNVWDFANVVEWSIPWFVNSGITNSEIRMNDQMRYHWKVHLFMFSNVRLCVDTFRNNDISLINE